MVNRLLFFSQELYMNFHEDIIIEILSFLDTSHVLTKDISYSWFKKYTSNRLKCRKSEKWYEYMYENWQGNCGVCKNSITYHSYIVNFCLECQFKLDDINYYPMICNECQTKPLKRGKVKLKKCCICDHSRMHLGVTFYS